MAKRRMFSMDVIDTDLFLEMPMSSQVLYFHLCLRADDDGFLASPKRILRLTGVSEDDLKILFAKQYVIPFDSGICVIRHWRMHNYIRGDRYKETIYKEEKSMVEENTEKAYQIKSICKQELKSGRPDDIPDDIPNGYTGKDRLGKDRLGKVNKENTCSEPSTKHEASPTVIEILTNKNEHYSVTEQDVEIFKGSYPAVDIIAELGKMKAWAYANPTNRKTKSGMLRFINSWLSKDQNRAGGKQKERYSSESQKSTLDGWKTN